MSVEKWADMAMLLEAKLDKANALNGRLVEALEKARHEIGAARIHSNHRIFFEHARKAQAIIEAALSAAKEPHHD